MKWLGQLAQAHGQAKDHPALASCAGCMRKRGRSRLSSLLRCCTALRLLSLSQRQTSLCMVQVVGDKRCPIVDTWWQTETGGHMITPLPAAWPEKPGSATLPFFGVVPAIVNEKGEAR